MKPVNETKIWVYADWVGLKSPHLMGVLHAQHIRGKEIFSFEYQSDWLKTNSRFSYLDPNLGFFSGKQFLVDERVNFGLFLDSSPDRWGRILMRRREALEAVSQKKAPRLLDETDYLLGVFDAHRMGALRFKADPNANFLDDHPLLATPPWTSLRTLEFASLQLENDQLVDHPDYSNWLNLLMMPGSSLGGARPKANVVDDHGNLWIAKFPSAFDEQDMGLWELLLNKLALSCGINVSEANAYQFTSRHHTFLTKRFDRISTNDRIHFASALTLLGLRDGVDFQDGVGYLDLASFIIQQGSQVPADLRQLWQRMLFNILVSNTDDHLRNHGFLLSDHGWYLSPAYDLNPNAFGNGLSLMIDQDSNEQSIELAMGSAKYYKLTATESQDILNQMVNQIKGWRVLALKMGISSAEIDRMQRAFRLVDSI